MKINSLHAGYFFIIFHLLTVCQVFQNCFKDNIRVSNDLALDLDRQNVGPDLGPNCLQMLSAYNKDHR